MMGKDAMYPLYSWTIGENRERHDTLSTRRAYYGPYWTQIRLAKRKSDTKSTVGAGTTWCWSMTEPESLDMVTMLADHVEPPSRSTLL